MRRIMCREQVSRWRWRARRPETTVDADIVARDQVQIVGFTSRAQAEHLLGNG